MKAKIGKRYLSTLTPKETPYEVWDIHLKGFLVRVYPSGSISFVCQYGRGKRITLEKSSAFEPDEARKWAKGILADAARGLDPGAERIKAKAKTYKEFITKDYSPWLHANRKRPQMVLNRLMRAFPDILNLPMSEITAWKLDKWRSAKLKTGISPSTTNRSLGELKAALSKAVKWGLLDTHPLANLKLSKEDTSAKVRYLSQDEEARLREALDSRFDIMKAGRSSGNAWRRQRGYLEMPSNPGDYLRPIILIAINTGMRRGELFNLKWEDIDHNNALLTVVGSGAKSGKTRHIPLNSEALAIVKAWQNQRESIKGHVFPGKYGEPFDNISTAWAKLLKNAKITGFRFHDLRHTFASKLVMAGVDLNTVRELLGHSDLKMTLRYAHLAPEHKAAAVAKLVKRDSPHTYSIPISTSDS